METYCFNKLKLNENVPYQICRLLKNFFLPDMVVHICNPSIQEDEAEGL
jgi:hypothetical protein